MQQLSFHCSAAERDNRIGTDKTATPRQRIQLVGSTLFFSFSLKQTHTATAAPTGSFWISKIYLSFEGEGAEKGGGDHRPKWEIFNPPLPAVTPLIRNQNPNINKRERERERERERIKLCIKRRRLQHPQAARDQTETRGKAPNYKSRPPSCNIYRSEPQRPPTTGRQTHREHRSVSRTLETDKISEDHPPPLPPPDVRGKPPTSLPTPAISRKTP